MNIYGTWWDDQTRQKGNSASDVSMCVFARLVFHLFLMKNYVVSNSIYECLLMPLHHDWSTNGNYLNDLTL